MPGNVPEIFFMEISHELLSIIKLIQLYGLYAGLKNLWSLRRMLQMMTFPLGECSYMIW